MAQTVPTREPASFTAGDTLTWKIALADYPAGDGWTLRYRLINAADKIDIVSTADGADHLVSVAASTTAAYVAGSYTWQSYVDGVSSQRFTVGNGSIIIKPNLAAQAAGYDTRTTAAKTLAAVNTWLTSKDLSVADIQLEGRALKRIPVAELLKLRSRLQAEVRREEAADRLAMGLPSKSKILVRF